ncbi:putative Homeobox protein FWA [Hibiscus syriacus]|uniref:Homeobox protein FWA n=1 Tax=Hibiscus syriacus TaxID=106335 RepID=A0A6A3AIF8_HIBSY|nr:putative Homeobox protein FWA [Hibiscus syriacus]
MDSMSRSTPVPPHYDDDENPEESSWTMYFKDFSNGNDDVVEMNGNRSCCSSDINHQTISDLEDTASSPFNSPKMCDMENQFGKIMKMKDGTDISKEEKGSGSTRERDESSSINGGENEETRPKKRGLCLVPLSMVVQHLGIMSFSVLNSFQVKRDAVNPDSSGFMKLWMS